MSLKEINIGSLGQVITGNTPPKKDPKNYGGSHPFVKPTDMTIGKRFVDKWDETYSEKAFEKYKRSLIPSGATGVVTIGTVGEKIFQSNQDCFTNQSVNVVIPNEDYDKDYVFYILKLNLNKVLSANPGTSSGRHHVSKSNFCSIKIDVVSCKKAQKKIASILSAYDDLTENNLKRIQLLEEAAQRIYKEWFVDFKFPNHEKTGINKETGLPEGWRIGAVEDLVNISSGFAFKSKDWKKSGNSVLKIKNLQNNTINVSDTAFVDNETTLKASKYELFEGDVLIAMTGATVGKIGLIPKVKKRLFLNQRVGLFRSIDGESNIPFIFSFFISNNGQKQVVNFAQGAAQPNISSSQIGQIQLNIPEKITLIYFNNKIGKFLKQIQLLNYQNQNLKEARDLLLPRLMNRTIEV
jgi:type I restriction enzyme S subunit